MASHRTRPSVATATTSTNSFYNHSASTPLHPARPGSTFTSGNATSNFSRPAATGASWQLILIDVKKDFSNVGFRQKYCKLSIVIIVFLLAGLIAAIALLWPRGLDVRLSNESLSVMTANAMEFKDTLPITTITPILNVDMVVQVTVDNPNFLPVELNDLVLSLTSKRSNMNVARSTLNSMSIDKRSTTALDLPVRLRFESTSDSGKMDATWLLNVCTNNVTRSAWMEFDVGLVGKWKPFLWPLKGIGLRGVAKLPCPLGNLSQPVFDGLQTSLNGTSLS